MKNAERKFYAAIFLLAAAAPLLTFSQDTLTFLHNPSGYFRPSWFFFYFQIISWLLFAAISPLIRRAVAKYPLNSPPHIMLHLLFGILASVSIGEMSTILRWIPVSGSMALGMFEGIYHGRNFLWDIITGIGVYFLFAGICSVYSTYDAFSLKRLQTAELEHTLAKDVLQVSRARVPSDMISERLDLIATTIPKDPEKADLLVTDLAAELRRQMNQMPNEPPGPAAGVDRIRNDRYLTAAVIPLLSFAFFSILGTAVDWLRFGLQPDWLMKTVQGLTRCALLIAATPLILVICRRWQISSGNWKKRIIQHSLFQLALWVVLSSIWFFLFNIHEEIFMKGTVEKMLLFALWKSLFPFAFLQYWSVVFFSYSFLNAEKQELERLRGINIDTARHKAHLQLLNMQIQPHFLFNLMNTIAECIHEQPEVARSMVYRLKDLFRKTSEIMELERISLTQELTLLQSYLDLQQYRFADRLSVSMRIAPGAENDEVPAMILQPFVENSIEHTIYRTSAQVTILINADFEEGDLRLSVADNGPGLHSKSPNENGIGLANCKKRLQLLYGDRYGLQFLSPENGGLQVILRIPR